MSNHGYEASLEAAEPDGTIDIYIETLTGTAFEITVSPFDTVMSIKSKIQRVEGIPVSQQHLLYDNRELEDCMCLIDYSISQGSTLKLVLAMKGGPISTRRFNQEDITWRELRDLVNNREDMFDIPPGCKMTVLVFREGDQVNLIRVVENEDGTYSPLSESWSGSSIRNLFAEEDPEEVDQRLKENSVTMGKMQELQKKLENISLQRKPKKRSSRVISSKYQGIRHRSVSQTNSVQKPKSPEEIFQGPSNSKNILHLPKLCTSDPTNSLTNSTSYLSTSSILSSQHNFTPTRIISNKQDQHQISDNNLQKMGQLLRTKSPALPARSLPQIGSIFPTINSSGSQEPARRSLSKSNANYNQRHSNSSACSFKTRSEVAVSPSINKSKLNVSCSSSILKTTPSITILEDSSQPVEYSPSRSIAFPSKESTTCTLSPAAQERIGTAIGSTGNRFTVSRVVLNETEERPKSSPEEVIQRQNSAREICDIFADPQWHKNSANSHTVNEARRIDDDCSEAGKVDKTDVKIATSVFDITEQSAKYGRRNFYGPMIRRESLLQSSNFATNQSSRDYDLFQGFDREANKLKSSHKKLPCSVMFPNLIGNTSDNILQKKPAKNRCSECRKRLNITNMYTCRCEKLFCATHRYSEMHNCTYDYKSEGRKIIEQANPLVTAPKLPKI